MFNIIYVYDYDLHYTVLRMSKYATPILCCPSALLRLPYFYVCMIYSIYMYLIHRHSSSTIMISSIKIINFVLVVEHMVILA